MYKSSQETNTGSRWSWSPPSFQKAAVNFIKLLHIPWQFLSCQPSPESSTPFPLAPPTNPCIETRFYPIHTSQMYSITRWHCWERKKWKKRKQKKSLLNSVLPSWEWCTWTHWRRWTSGDSIMGRVVQRCREQQAHTSQHGYDQEKSPQEPKGTLDNTGGHLSLPDGDTDSRPGLFIHLVPGTDGRWMWALKVMCLRGSLKCSKAVLQF